MKNHFKPHIVAMRRYQTSTGRDIDNGYRLDRNERVSNFSDRVLADIFASMPPYVFNVTPDTGPLYGKLAEFHGIERSKLYVMQGITEGIRVLYETLTNPGENIICLDPTYPMYQVYAEAFQLDYRKFTYGADLKPNWDSLWDQMDAKTTLVIIPNPNLPIETAFTPDEIRHLATRCKENGTILVVDEAYHYLGDVAPVIDLVDEFDNLVVLRTFSKAMGMPGIRLGYMISQPQNIEYLSKTRSLVETNGPSMYAALYLLDHPELKDEHAAEVRAGAKHLQDSLTAMGIRWDGGNVTSGLMLFLESAEASKSLAAYLRERKIYVRGGFEAPFDVCVRVSLGLPEAMEAFLEGFRNWRAATVG